MTAEIDTSPEAVERLASDVEAHVRRLAGNPHVGSLEASALRALAAERDAAVARAEAAEAKLAGRVKVKPLEWFEAQLPSRGGGKFTAEGYTIQKIEGLWLVVFAGQGKREWQFSTLEAAKAAGQADYERRILAALEGQDD